MKLRTFLPLVTYPDASNAAALPNAVGVARLLAADLHALALEVDIPPVSSALSRMLLNLPEMIQDAEKLSAVNGATLLTTARSAAESAGVAVTTGIVKAPLALIGEAAAERARYFDISLVGLVPGNASVRMVAEAVLFGAGKPAVLIPDQAKVTGSIDHVAIAWDGSRVAARAVSDARILLDRAARVTVVTVTDEKPLKEKDAGERLAESLRSAGLQAQFSAVRAEDSPIAETLQAHAAECGADFLVMGAYGHSRLRDFVLGGATEGVLSDLKLPILLSH